MKTNSKTVSLAPTGYRSSYRKLTTVKRFGYTTVFDVMQVRLRWYIVSES